MEPHTKTVKVKVKVKAYRMPTTQLEFKCKMHQLPVNLDNVTAGQKLQSMTKDFIVITSWPPGGLFECWEYTVLFEDAHTERALLVRRNWSGKIICIV